MKLLFLLLLLSPLAYSADFTARVVKVHDADTIVVLQDGKNITIRLKGIDCPELGDASGLRSKNYASDKILDKNVKLKTYGTDRYHRTIADVFLENGKLWNQELVLGGYCKWGRSRAMRSE